MIAAPIAFAGLLLLAAASRRPADHLGLSPRTRRIARWVGGALLGVSAVLAYAGSDAPRRLVGWVLELGILIPPVGLLSTWLLSKRKADRRAP